MSSVARREECSEIRRSRRRQQIGDGARRRGGALALRAFGQPLGVALVQTHDRVAETIAGEDLRAAQQPGLVDLPQQDDLDLREAHFEVWPRVDAIDREEIAGEGQIVSEAGQQLPAVDHPVRLEHRPPAFEQLGAAVGQAGRMVYDLELGGEDASERIDVAARHGSLEERPGARRGIAVHAPGNARLRSLGRQRVEARERFGLAVGVEPLGARERARPHRSRRATRKGRS